MEDRGGACASALSHTGSGSCTWTKGNQIKTQRVRNNLKAAHLRNELDKGDLRIDVCHACGGGFPRHGERVARTHRPRIRRELRTSCCERGRGAGLRFRGKSQYAVDGRPTEALRVRRFRLARACRVRARVRVRGGGCCGSETAWTRRCVWESLRGSSR